MKFRYGATATYTDRVCVWVPGGAECDGHMILTVHKASGLPESSAYQVQWTADGVVVWKAGGRRQRYYRVTAGRCTCDGMRPVDRTVCKHLDAMKGLVDRGVFPYLPAGDFDRPISGAGKVAGVATIQPQGGVR